MMLRAPPENSKTIRLQIKALVGLRVDTTKSSGNNVRAYVCLSRKNELQCISSPSNPLTLAASEKRWIRNRQSVRRHVAVWSTDNTIVLENVTASQLVELHVFVKEESSRAPECLGTCQWSLAVADAQGTMDLILTPSSQQSPSAFSIDKRRDAILRVDISADEPSLPTTAQSSRPQIESMSLSATHKDILCVYNSIKAKDDASKCSLRDGRPAKVRRGTSQWRWRERRTKKELRQKRSWWQKLTSRSKRNTDYGYQLGDDETKIDGEDPGRNMEQNKATGSSSAKMSRPESPWDPFGILSTNKWVDITATMESDDGNVSQTVIRKSPSAAAEEDTLCYSVASESEHFTCPNALVLRKARGIYDEVPDPDILFLSDDETDNSIGVTFDEQENDDEIEMAFEADSGILVLSHSSRIRQVESPRGLAHLFNCWESQSEQHPQDGARRDDEAVTVFDSTSAENSFEGKSQPLRNSTAKREKSPPMKMSEEIVARNAPPSQTASSIKNTRMPRKKWAMIDTFSEGITDWLHCGPSILEKKTMRTKKTQESDANLLGIFVKRNNNVEDVPLYYLPEYRSPSSVTMSDVMQ